MPNELPITPVDRFDVTIADLPGSKSLTNRALLLAALADGESTLHNVLLADDTRVMLAALGKLGFDPRVDDRTVTLTGHAGAIPVDDADLILGNAGTAMRFLTAACCLGRGTYTLDGIARMRQRPIAQLVDPLRTLAPGVVITYLGDEGFPPLEIAACGLAGGIITLQPTLSSQYISALLQVAPCSQRGITITFDGPVTSWPYVEMTTRLMQQFGITFDTPPTDQCITIAPGVYQAGEHTIEPDASNASYFLAAAATHPGSRCTIRHLGRTSLQGDAAFAHVLGQMGADVVYTADSITVIGSDELVAVDVDLNAMPDMAQTLAVAALFADGETIIRNVGNLRIKETDRLAALDNELTKLDATVAVKGDDLHITPPAGGKLTPAAIDTYDDHRMAMAFAVAGLRSPGVVINDPACVNKTFPRYFDYLGRLSGS